MQYRSGDQPPHQVHDDHALRCPGDDNWICGWIFDQRHRIIVERIQLVAHGVESLEGQMRQTILSLSAVIRPARAKVDLTVGLDTKGIQTIPNLAQGL